MHTKGDGNDLFSATNTADDTTTMRIKDDGNVEAPDFLYGAQHRSLETHINSTISTLNDASNLDLDTENIVKRSIAEGTEIDNLQVVARTTGYTRSYPPAGLYFSEGTCDNSIDLLAQGQLTYIPYDSNGDPIDTKRVVLGRAQPLQGETRAQADSKRDGLLIEDDAVDISAEILCSDELPTIRLVGTKATTTDSNGYVKPVAPVIEVQDSSGTVTFAVYDDGFVVQKGHLETDPDSLAPGHFKDGVFGDDSVYIGSSRLSYDRATHQLILHTLKHQIPVFLQGHNLPAAQVPVALDQMSVHSWIALARTFLSNPHLQASDVFPPANADWNTGAITQISNTFATERTVRVAAENALSGRIDTLEVDPTTQAAVDAKQDAIVRAATCYCDAKRTDSYTEDGSIAKPYKTLSAAITARCEDAATDTVHFVLQSGTYTGAINKTKAAINQSICIQGAGPDHTIISAPTLSSNILFLRRFAEVKLLDCTVRTGAYGFYPRDCTSVIMNNVHFEKCGSVGTVNRHDLSSTQAEQTAYWGSTDTSNGGACRIRDVARVRIRDCKAEYCARGLRIQDCGTADAPSTVQGCEIFRCLESGIYLAAGTYTGTTGCKHFKISNNIVRQCYNNGLLVIGGQHCSVVSNTVSECSNSGIMVWHPLDVSVQGNVVTKCNHVQHNGVGNLGDAWASIHIEGATGIGTGHCIANVHGNTMIQCGQGRAASVRGISIMHNDPGSYVAHPAASNKAFIGYNRDDAAVNIYNPNSVVLNEPGAGNLSAYSTTTQMNAALALKNDLIEDGDLTIGRTSGLQGAIDGKMGSTFGAIAAANTTQPVTGAGILSFGNSNWSGGGSLGAVAAANTTQAASGADVLSYGNSNWLDNTSYVEQTPTVGTIPVWPDVLNSNSTSVPTEASLSHYAAANGGQTQMQTDYAQLWSHNSGPKGVEIFTRSQVEVMMWEDLDDVNNSVRTRSDTPWTHVPYVFLPYKRMRIRLVVNRDRTGAGISQQTGSSTSRVYLRVRSPHIKPGAILVGSADLSDVGEFWSNQNVGLDIKRIRYEHNEAEVSWAIRNYLYYPPSALRNHSNGGDGFTTGSELYMDIQIL